MNEVQEPTRGIRRPSPRAERVARQRGSGLMRTEDTPMPHTIEETRDGRLLLVKLGPLGPVSNNAYIVADTATNDAVIIDAPAESTYVIPQTAGLNVRRIIVTHRHRDHWGGIDELLAGIDVPVYTHELDREPYYQYVRGTLAHDDEVEVG